MDHASCIISRTGKAGNKEVNTRFVTPAVGICGPELNSTRSTHAADVAELVSGGHGDPSACSPQQDGHGDYET